MPVTIGDRGRAVTPLRPAGFVDVNGTRLEAKLAPSRTLTVETGAAVVIVGTDTFGVLVKAADDVTHPNAIPGYGEPVPTPAEQGELREEIEARNYEEEKEETQRDLQKESIIFVVPLIIVFAGGSVLFGNEAAVALGLAWIVIFFGLGLALSLLGGDS